MLTGKTEEKSKRNQKRASSSGRVLPLKKREVVVTPSPLQDSLLLCFFLIDFT